MTRAAALAAALLAFAACGGGDDDDSIEPFAFTACGSEYDLDADGSIDTRWAFEYDVLGYPTVDRADNEDDGSIDLVVTYHYEDGELLDYHWDEGLDGDFEYTYEATFDDHLVRRLQIDSDGDELINQDSSYFYEGDRRTRSDTDLAGSGMMIDGAIDVRDTYVYDGDLLVGLDSDFDLDGTRDSATYFDHDDDGNVVAQHTDSGADGTDDRVDTWAYDADGHRTRFTIDLTPSTTELDLIQDYTWDGDDIQATESTSEVGNYPRSSETYLYDCP